MRLRTLALGMTLNFGAGCVAFAQQAPEIPNIQAERELNFEARLSGAYDTNVARGSKLAAARRNLKLDDMTLTPSAGISLVQPIGQQTLFLDGNVGYDFHARNKRLDRERYDVTGGATTVVGPCRPVAYATFKALQSDLSDLDFAVTSNVQRATGVAAGAQCGGSVGLGGSLIGQRIDTKNSSSKLTLQDHTAETLFGSLSYSAPTLVNATVFYSYANNEFPNRINPGRPVGDGFWTQTYGVRLERKFGSRVAAGVSGSRTRLKREFAFSGQPLTIDTTTYDGQLSYNLGTRLLLVLGAGREVRPSDRPGKLYDISETLEGSALYKLGSRLNVKVGHVYTDVVSNVDTAQSRSVITNSITNGTYGSIEFRRVGNGALILDVRRERRNTNVPDFNYKSTRVGLTTVISF